MECLVNRPHSDTLARKVECIGQADLLDCRFARLASKPADLANRSEHRYKIPQVSFSEGIFLKLISNIFL